MSTLLLTTGIKAAQGAAVYAAGHLARTALTRVLADQGPTKEQKQQIQENLKR